MRYYGFWKEVQDDNSSQDKSDTDESSTNSTLEPDITSLALDKSTNASSSTTTTSNYKRKKSTTTLSNTKKNVKHLKLHRQHPNRKIPFQKN